MLKLTHLRLLGQLVHLNYCSKLSTDLGYISLFFCFQNAFLYSAMRYLLKSLRCWSMVCSFFSFFPLIGWSGSGGLGAKEQGIQDPIKGGDIRDKWDQYKGVGVALDDPYENYRRNKSYSFIARMKARDECKWTSWKMWKGLGYSLLLSWWLC